MGFCLRKELTCQCRFKGHKRRRRRGLGLYIAKAIIDLDGGKIGYELEVGVGSEFYFILPLANLRVDVAAT
jgi:signal transduction histidine kinase